MKYTFLILVALLAGCASLGSTGDKAAPEQTANENDDTHTGGVGLPATNFKVETAAVEFLSEKTTFVSDGVELQGELLKPAGAGARPAAVIFHDIGPLNRDGIFKSLFAQELPVEVAVYRSIAEELAGRGFVVLLYDKRSCVTDAGVGCRYPQSHWEKGTHNASHLLKDAAAAVAHLKSVEGVDKDKLLLIGHGQGAELALALNSNLPRVLLTPSAYPMDELVMHQTESSLDMLNNALASMASSAETDEMQKRKAELEAALKAQQTTFAQIRKGENTEFGGISVDGWRAYFALHDKALKAKPNQVLVIVGSEDLSLPDDNELVWEQIYNGNVKELEINHALVDIDKDAAAVSPEVFTTILEWVASPDTAP